MDDEIEKGEGEFEKDIDLANLKKKSQFDLLEDDGSDEIFKVPADEDEEESFAFYEADNDNGELFLI